MTSKEKVENVVNPPQIPTVSISINLGSIGIILAENTVIAPIKKEPKKFINIVTKGNAIVKEGENTFIKYLKTLPIKPPNPTYKQVNNFYTPFYFIIIALPQVFCSSVTFTDTVSATY